MQLWSLSERNLTTLLSMMNYEMSGPSTSSKCCQRCPNSHDTDRSPYIWWKPSSTVSKYWNKLYITTHDHLPRPASIKNVCKMGSTSAFRSVQRGESWCCTAVSATFWELRWWIIWLYSEHGGGNMDPLLDTWIQKTEYSMEREIQGNSKKGYSNKIQWQGLWGF